MTRRSPRRSTRQSPQFGVLVDQFLKQTDADLADRAVPAQLASAFVDWLYGLAEAGDLLAKAALNGLHAEAAQKWIKEGIARRVGWVDQATGENLAARTRAGTPIRDERGARTGGFQQVLFRKMTRREFEDHLAMLRSNRAALSASITLGNRILRAWDEHPQARYLEQVCRMAAIELPPEFFSASTS